MVKKVTQGERVKRGVETISNLIKDDGFIAQQAPYIRTGNQIISPKIIDVLNDRRTKLDTLAQLKGLIGYVNNALPGHELVFGSAFLIPYPSVIGLPSPYYATRYYPERGQLIFSTIINTYANYGGKSDPSLYGYAYILFGKLSVAEPTSVKDDLTESIIYLNDVLTAYRLMRHDHTIQNITQQKLPSLIDYYDLSLKPEVNIGEPEPVRLHSHDLMDVWAKRLPDTKADLERFVQYCEQLPLSGEVRYLLKVMTDSITSFCLGDLEDTVLNSDRFAELSLRFCFTKMPSLRVRDVSTLRNLYSKDHPDTGVLNLLVDELNLKGNHVISLWYSKARMLRNDLAHGLRFDLLTRAKAQAALKYNLEIVKLISEKVPGNDWAVSLLRLGADTYKDLFET